MRSLPPSRMQVSCGGHFLPHPTQPRPVVAWLTALLLAGCSGAVSTTPEDAVSGSGGVSGEAGAPGEAPSGGRPGPAACTESVELPPRLWQLSPEQIVGEMSAVLGEPLKAAFTLEATGPDPYGRLNDADFTTTSSRFVEDYMDTVEAFAEKLAARPDRLPGCANEKPITANCIGTVVAEVGAKAYRRAVSQGEMDAAKALFQEQSQQMPHQEALQTVLASLFLSPHFLYRTELGAGGGEHALSQEEIATALAFLISDRAPDAELMAAASRGELDEPNARELHARRLLGNAATSRGFLRFLTDSFGVRRAELAEKDPEKYPTFSVELAQHMTAESVAFLQSLVSDEGSLLDLLTSRRSFLNKALAEHYGVTGNFESGRLTATTMPPERSGIITHGSWLTILASDKEASITQRGHFIQELLLCQSVPSPSAEDINNFPDIPDGLNILEEAEFHAANPGCRSCHQVLDAPGMALTRFDGIGRYRDTIEGKDLPAKGSFETLDGRKVDVDGASALGRALAAEPAVHRCFSRRVLEYTWGRALTEADECVRTSIEKAWNPEEGSLADAFVAAVRHASFITRKP